jgi:hypothetical protein
MKILILPPKAEGWDQTMYSRKLSASVLAVLMSSAAFALISWDVEGEAGSGDGWGYSWTDSNAPDPMVVFDWLEISSTGTDVGFYGADNVYLGPFPLGFDFTFYGQAYTEFYISCNGFVSFGSGASNSYNYPIPYQYDSTNNIVAPFWDDLVVDDWPYNSGAVYYETIGTTPNSQLVVEYYQVSRDYYYNLMTFEIILNETGEIWFQYLSMNGETGSSSSVGIENDDGTMGNAYSYNQPTISDGLAVLFEEGIIGFGPDQSQMSGWDSSVQYSLTLRNGQAITDSFEIEVDYTYMGWGVELYDDSYVLLADSNLNGIPDTGDLAPGEITQIFAVVTIPAVPVDQNETTTLLASSYADNTVNDTATLTTRASQAILSPPHSDYGYDSDLDGDNDSLVVDIVVESISGGYLSVFAYLYDYGLSEYIASGWGSASAPLGTSMISLYFDGEDIHGSMIDGPYQVYFWLYDRDGYAIDSATHETSAYLYSDFDEPVAMFAPPHDDYGRDDDSNGMYDFLVVNVSLQVYEAGYYTVEADLEDSFWGSWISYQEYSEYLDAGAHVVQILFPAGEVNESALDDTCEVYMTLYLNNSTWVANEYYTTDHYVYTDFEGLPVEFLPPHDDYAEDTDSDGYYNNLVVTIYIECYETGLYDLTVWVYDPWGYFMRDIHETVSMDSGTTYEHVIMLTSDEIRSLGRSGYYYFDLYLYDNGTAVEYDYDYYTTDQYYWYDDFDPVGAYFDSVDDFGRDTDSDGRYNEIVVTLSLYPLSTGYFELEVDIYDYYYYWMNSIEALVYMEEGVFFEYEVVIDGYDFISNGVQGYMYLEMYVNDETGTYNYDDYWDYTSYYYFDDFDPIGAFFESPHDDYGRDDDADGLYDYLVFTIYVNASTSGYYDLEVDVWDYWGYYDNYWMELYLPADTVTSVEIEIDSYSIWRNGVSGYWYLDLYVYDHVTSTMYDSDYHDAGYYYLSDFDPPGVLFDPPHNDYAYDYDGDSYYDYIVLEVYLDCTQSGVYTVYGDLYDDWGAYLTTVSDTRSMNVGGRSVDLVYEGWIIEFNGVSGYFEIDLTVESAEGLVLDYDTHYTDYYYYYDFEGPPAEFSPPHEDCAYDTDDDGLFENLQVNASVEVYIAGDYAVFAVLYDGYGDPADYASAEMHLEEGTNLVELSFSGWSVAVAGTDPWYVALELYDDLGNIMDYDSHDIWGSYFQADFDSTTPTIASVWAFDPVTADGVVNGAEWLGALGVYVVAADVMNEVDATIYVRNNDTHLFVLVDAVGDTSPSAGDGALVGFDTGNDEVLADGHEDWFAVVTTSAGYDTIHMAYNTGYWDWETDCFPFDDTNPEHEGLAGAAGFGPSPWSTTSHRVYEFCIPLALIVASPGDTVGFAGIPIALDGDSDAYSSWPAYFAGDYPPLSFYGDLLLSVEPPLTTIELSGDEGEAGWYLSPVEATLSSTEGVSAVNHTYYRVDDGSWTEYSDSFTVTEDGVHTVEFYSDDVAGNVEPVHTVVAKIDTELPETSASVEGTIGQAGWLLSEATIVFDRDDETSGVAVTMYRLDDGDWMERSGTTLDIDEEGPHTLEYYSVDVAGNEESVKSIEFKVDTVAPVTTISVDGHMVTLSVADQTSGAAATWYRIDGGDWAAYETPFEIKGRGNHTVECYSTDAAGNNETVKTTEVAGSSTAAFFGLDFWMVLLIIAIMAGLAVAVIFGMRRRARMADSRAIIKDSVSAVSQMYDEPQPAWPQGQAPPPGEEPPPPGEKG